MTPRRVADDIAFCLVFLTRLPLPAQNFGARTLGQAIWAAPLVGVAVGVIGAVTYLAALTLGVPVPVAAALVIAATMLTTGALHEDGFSDVADGFGGGGTRDKKLEIMRDSRIGAYGAAALGTSMLLRWSAIGSLANPLHVGLALIAAHAASRALLPAFMHRLPPARADGLGAGAGTVASEPALVALAIGAAALLPLGFTGLIAAAVVLGLLFSGFRALCMRQIGGQTGDTLGALQQVAEIGVLVVAAAILT